MTALARLLVCRVVERGAVPAHAQHLAAARRARHHARRHRRGHRSRHRHQEQRLVVDRPPAFNFQFSGQAYYEVRNGKIAGMLRDVAYQSNTPVFWNSMDMIGGKSSVLAGRSVQRRQGRAVASQLRQPRMPAVPLPQRHHPQHGTQKIMTPRQKRRGARRSRARVQQSRPDAREHRQRLERQHALRRRQHHDVGRRHRRHR